jgi:hypothetical protein
VNEDDATHRASANRDVERLDTLPWQRIPPIVVGKEAPDLTDALAVHPGALDENLRVLGTTGPLEDEEYAALAEHGERVRRNARGLPLSTKRGAVTDRRPAYLT